MVAGAKPRLGTRVEKGAAGSGGSVVSRGAVTAVGDEFQQACRLCDAAVGDDPVHPALAPQFARSTTASNDAGLKFLATANSQRKISQRRVWQAILTSSCEELLAILLQRVQPLRKLCFGSVDRLQLSDISRSKCRPLPAVESEQLRLNRL